MVAGNLSASNNALHNNVPLPINVLRQQAGYYAANEYGLLAISGKDATAYLQSQLSNDINKLKPGHGQLTCLLDRKAHVLAYFHLFKSNAPAMATSGMPPAFYLIAETQQLQDIIAHLEQFRFAAQVDFVDISQQGKFIAIEGPRYNRFLYQMGMAVHLTALPELDMCDIKYGDHKIRIFRHSLTGENGYFLWAQEKDYAKLYKSVTDTAIQFHFVELSKDIVETSRIEAGLARFARDFGQENLLPETGLEANTVSYTKGCFTGQEVLARVKSHGLPAKALIGLIIERNPAHQSQSFPVNSPILSSGEEIGILKSNAFSSTLNKFIAFAFLKRDYRVPEKTIIAQIAGESITATVTTLPFIAGPSRHGLAQRFYEQAVQQYIKDADNTMPSAVINLLEEALAFDSQLEDAYEALAVILGKHEQLDQAITLMKKLAQLNPDSVMAHSNLSQFYMQQGNKELAEEEKAVALGIRMRLAAAEVMAETKLKEEENKDTEEIKRRMSMFEQVLAIDSEDFFANAGLGECLVDMKEYERAIPCLQKAITLKAIHMPSYFALAKAYKESGSTALAKNLLQEAIALATKRGDTTALQQLRNELATMPGD